MNHYRFGRKMGFSEAATVGPSLPPLVTALSAQLHLPLKVVQDALAVSPLPSRQRDALVIAADNYGVDKSFAGQTFDNLSAPSPISLPGKPSASPNGPQIAMGGQSVRHTVTRHPSGVHYPAGNSMPAKNNSALWLVGGVVAAWLLFGKK